MFHAGLRAFPGLMLGDRNLSSYVELGSLATPFCLNRRKENYMNIMAKKASLLMFATSLLLTSLPAIADRYSDAVCGENCPRGGSTLDLIVFVVIVIIALFIGQPRTKVFIAIWLGIPLAMSVITGNAIWVLAYIPSFFLALWIAEPIAKYFGWENDKR